MTARDRHGRAAFLPALSLTVVGRDPHVGTDPGCLRGGGGRTGPAPEDENTSEA